MVLEIFLRQERKNRVYRVLNGVEIFELSRQAQVPRCLTTKTSITRSPNSGNFFFSFLIQFKLY